ncbi:hypothetical protein DYB36_010499 [Aphanomyces astaci]|uniref:Uncharacterized protein n=2 Tax=Aphanomyces astaci TaxID=112090 RepID=A0A397A0D7_APHAT|nr:hypothetical protein DYB36_010499 [Aphanomyces astaci]
MRGWCLLVIVKFAMFRYYYHVPPTSLWDFVRPTYWHPMASLEQSLMDLDALERDSLLLPLHHPHHHHRHLHLRHSADDDDAFFKDLPHAKAPAKNDATSPATTEPASNDPSHAATSASKPVYSNYSYSSSSVVDDKGRRVRSVRRRYEDANGRLKAVHEREVDGKTLVTTWNRATKDDAGTHDTICSDGAVDAFEALWKDTPFAKAHQAGEALPPSDQTKSGDANEENPAVDTAQQPRDVAMA